MEPLNLVNTKKEWGLIYLLLFFLFLFHLFFHFLHYQEIIQEEVYQDTFIVKNIYPKETYTTLKLSNDSITYFTSINKDQNILKLDTVESFFLTSNISFYDYLKGFYTPSFAITIINKNHHQTPIANFIDTQHTNKEIVDIYKALFLAIPLPQDINIQNANFGVSHLFAISGFHLAVILTFLYFLFNLSYTKVHKNYFPYRNKRFDILVLSSIIIFSYLIYIDLVASFLRSFVMFFIGIIFLRSHIKVLSFNTLLLTFVIIITLFPKLLFSL
ncbi:MAG TPA: ComEC/Rec2 family competence protein, partial [Arcobacter sp.]|nr:ComEC/Rec2 family competence protein [Arcobacter sp.]